MEAEVLGPGDAAVLIFSEFVHAKVRADTGDAPIVQHFAQLGTFVFGEAAEARIVVTYRRTEFDVLKTGRNELLDRSGKILGDPFSHWPSLAADGQTERISVEFE